jgi:hypothetical protein
LDVVEQLHLGFQGFQGDAHGDNVPENRALLDRFIAAPPALDASDGQAVLDGVPLLHDA